MNVEIPAECGPIVARLIERGEYRDANDVVIAGLRLLCTREQLKLDVEAGIAQLEAGQVVDGAAVFARLEKRARELAARKAD